MNLLHFTHHTIWQPWLCLPDHQHWELSVSLDLKYSGAESLEYGSKTLLLRFFSYGVPDFHDVVLVVRTRAVACGRGPDVICSTV